MFDDRGKVSRTLEFVRREQVRERCDKVGEASVVRRERYFFLSLSVIKHPEHYDWVFFPHSNSKRLNASVDIAKWIFYAISGASRYFSGILLSLFPSWPNDEVGVARYFATAL